MILDPIPAKQTKPKFRYRTLINFDGVWKLGPKLWSAPFPLFYLEWFGSENLGESVCSQDKCQHYGCLLSLHFWERPSGWGENFIVKCNLLLVLWIQYLSHNLSLRKLGCFLSKCLCCFWDEGFNWCRQEGFKLGKYFFAFTNSRVNVTNWMGRLMHFQGWVMSRTPKVENRRTYNIEMVL